MGSAAQGRNTAHQKKDLSAEERLACARSYDIPLDDGWRMLMVRNVTAERQDAADVRILKIRVL